MKFKLHNKLEITKCGKTYKFFNTMFPSVFSKLQTLSKYFTHIAFGTGQSSADYKLGSYQNCYQCFEDFIQDDASLSEIYSKKYVVISDSSLDGQNLTEAGICTADSDNPTIFNYFSLISDETPSGILKTAGEELYISITIYLEIANETAGLLTSGSNKFIDFLLGEGIADEIYACRGYNLSDNNIISRETFSAETYPCDINFNISSNDDDAMLEIEFSSDLSYGETYEIVFFIGDVPFARINTLETLQTTTENSTIVSELNNIIIMGKDVKAVNSVISSSTETDETDSTYVSKYATSFGDKITLPFANRFGADTPRFLSKDGKIIFFVSDDKVYGYENINYCINEISMEYVNFSGVTKIVAFDKFIFVVTNVSPYIYMFIRNSDGKFVLGTIDFGEVETLGIIEDIFDIDITMNSSEQIMFGIIDTTNRYGYALYFDFDETSLALTLSTYLYNTKTMTYVLAMICNNFTDARILFLKVGTNSVTSRCVYFFADTTTQDVYSTYAWKLLRNTKEIYVKNRAIIVEKDEVPSLYMYYYPAIQEASIEISETEVNNYVSTNLLYLVQKSEGNKYKIYSLVGYITPTEFEDGIPSEIDQSKILDFEFMNDTLLIFINSSEEPIVAYNLFDNGTLIENVSEDEAEYEVESVKYNILGKNEGIIATFKVRITL